MPVEPWVVQLTEEVMGAPPFAIGDVVTHPSGHTIKIVSGQYWGEYGLSNHWYWREVLPDGTLSENLEYGYGWISRKSFANAKPHCVFCEANHGVKSPAKFVAAQSEDRGVTIQWVLVCADHADGWNDGSDWDAPMFAIFPLTE